SLASWWSSSTVAGYLSRAPSGDEAQEIFAQPLGFKGLGHNRRADRPTRPGEGLDSALNWNAHRLFPRAATRRYLPAAATIHPPSTLGIPPTQRPGPTPHANPPSPPAKASIPAASVTPPRTRTVRFACAICSWPA